ncbi:hypothetical protein GIB67_024991 [Kingdonia uniflora]|uniref:RNase H type-1 domain-containing protein n=1 Tax=Kingdonia uniflora TaxID=39325 RepID=A0A7J7N7L8_9MAGN|nr:hypothetical protein GIB67_024991 [Kingdonia uniflora]
MNYSLSYYNQTDLGILRCLGVAVHSCKHPLVKSFFWELPRIREIKINTDGVAKGNPSKGGIGCIFRDCNGKVMGTLSKGLGLVTNFMAECKAIILRVEHAASFGWLIAWIESDSTTAVEAFKTNNIPWILKAAWENARRNMSHARSTLPENFASLLPKSITRFIEYLNRAYKPDSFTMKNKFKSQEVVDPDEYKFIADIPSPVDFKMEEFLDLVNEVEHFFKFMEIPEVKQLKMVDYKLKGVAAVW